MNDDELDKLFGVEEEEKPEEEKQEEISSVSDHAGGNEEPREVRSSSDKPSEDKREARRKAREEQERIAREYAEKKEAEREQRARERERRRKERLERKQKRREEKQALDQRDYLKDFPLSFTQVLLILLGITVVVLIVTVIISPFFRMENVIITGNYQLSDSEILELTGMEYGDHLFAIDKSREKEIIRDNPYISDIRIRASYPSALKIEVSERRKIAYIKTPDGYIAIDDEGTVLEFSSDYNESVHPVICGLDIDHVIIGEKLDIRDDLRYQKMIIVLGAVLAADMNSMRTDHYSFFDSLLEVRIIPSGYIFLKVRLPEGSVLQVKLADIDSISDDMHWLMYSIEEDAFYNAPPGALDMTGDKYIYREYM